MHMQKRVLEPLELELQMVASGLMGVGSWTQNLCKSIKVSTFWAISPACLVSF